MGLALTTLEWLAIGPDDRQTGNGGRLASTRSSSTSPTLRQYKLVWSKALPSGRLLDLHGSVPRVYLHHRSELGTLSTDSVMQTFTSWTSLKRITELLTGEENEAFKTIGYTASGMMVFQGKRVDGNPRPRKYFPGQDLQWPYFGLDVLKSSISVQKSRTTPANFGINKKD